MGLSVSVSEGVRFLISKADFNMECLLGKPS